MSAIASTPSLAAIYLTLEANDPKAVISESRAFFKATLEDAKSPDRNRKLVQIIDLCHYILSQRSSLKPHFTSIRPDKPLPAFSKELSVFWAPETLLGKVTAEKPLTKVIQEVWDQATANLPLSPELKSRYWSYDCLKEVALLAKQVAMSISTPTYATTISFYWLDILCLYREGLDFSAGIIDDEKTRSFFQSRTARLQALADKVASLNKLTEIPALAGSGGAAGHSGDLSPETPSTLGEKR